jgi:hypothetical protein
MPMPSQEARARDVAETARRALDGSLEAPEPGAVPAAMSQWLRAHADSHAAFGRTVTTPTPLPPTGRSSIMPQSNTYDWSDMASLASAVTSAERSARALQREVASGAASAAELVADTYSWAGRLDSVCNARAGQVLRPLLGVSERLEEIATLLKHVRGELKRATDAADEARVRRNSHGPTLNV